LPNIQNSNILPFFTNIRNLPRAPINVTREADPIVTMDWISWPKYLQNACRTGAWGLAAGILWHRS